jgi:hypothetical protein
VDHPHPRALPGVLPGSVPLAAGAPRGGGRSRPSVLRLPPRRPALCGRRDVRFGHPSGRTCVGVCPDRAHASIRAGVLRMGVSPRNSAAALEPALLAAHAAREPARQSLPPLVRDQVLRPRRPARRRPRRDAADGPARPPVADGARPRLGPLAPASRRLAGAGRVGRGGAAARNPGGEPVDSAHVLPGVLPARRTAGRLRPVRGVPHPPRRRRLHVVQTLHLRVPGRRRAAREPSRRRVLGLPQRRAPSRR